MHVQPHKYTDLTAGNGILSEQTVMYLIVRVKFKKKLFLAVL